MSTFTASRRRPVLITVSGIVGSGKTTTVRQIAGLLQAEGRKAHELSFQSLPCFKYLRASVRAATRPTGNAAELGLRGPVERWQGYRQKRLTVVVALVYLVRIAVFQLYRVRWQPGEWYVLNRYFYDLFVHYRLASRTERLLLGVLRRFVPRADVAFLIDGDTDTIALRRPTYSREYVSEVGQAYRTLRKLFPELVVLTADPGAPADQNAHVISRALRSAGEQ